MGKFLGLGLGLVAVMAALGGSTAARADDDGEKLFKKYCSACHTTDEGKNRVGPSLHAVVGRTAGSIGGFAYSAGVKAAGFTWTPEKLDSWLTDPKALIPGNKMTFAGVKDAGERTALIGFLRDK